MESELYVSVDIEANGPIPGPNSLWSLGAVAFFNEKTVGEFEVNLQELERSKGDPDTLAWWAKQDPKVLEACRANPQPPERAMQNFVSWVETLANEHKAKPVCVAYPAGFDFMFTHWYCVNFVGRDPFGFSCLDMKSYAMAVLRTPFRKTVKKNMPKQWFQGLPPHTHQAIDDAREQGLLFLNMVKHAHLP